MTFTYIFIFIFIYWFIFLSWGVSITFCFFCCFFLLQFIFLGFARRHIYIITPGFDPYPGPVQQICAELGSCLPSVPSRCCLTHAACSPPRAWHRIVRMPPPGLWGSTHLLQSPRGRSQFSHLITNNGRAWTIIGNKSSHLLVALGPNWATWGGNGNEHSRAGMSSFRSSCLFSGEKDSGAREERSPRVFASVQQSLVFQFFLKQITHE